MTSTVPEQQPQTFTYNHPCHNLPLEKYIDIFVPLYKAIIKGDRDAANVILIQNENLKWSSITENKETILHIAAMGQSTHFMKCLITKMKAVNLNLQNKDGNTAFCLAVIAGNVDMVKIMIENENDQRLLTARGNEMMMPLYLAASYGNLGMVTYLYSICDKMPSALWTYDDRNMVFLKCIEADLYDVALNILNDGIDVPQGEYVSEVLHLLARKRYAFDDIEPRLIWKTISSIFQVFHLKVGTVLKVSGAAELLRKILEKIVVKPKNEVDEILKGRMFDNGIMQTYPSRIIFVAAAMGNVKFLVELILIYPDLIWERNDIKQTIFHVAVSHRHENVYSLLHEIGSIKDTITPLTDEDGNNMLHLVGMNAERKPYEDMLTAPFQMQRELLWFKEVKGMIPPSHREAKNRAGQTPSELFSENHEVLLSESKMWIKETINQCMVASVLIATIGFSVVWSVPGGYDQQTGFPLFIHNGHLLVFVVFDAISFVLSSLSLILFLSIVVSRYTQTDFLESLPQKLTIGLASLFLSILTIMVAFGVTFHIHYHHKLLSVPLVIWAIGFIPFLYYSKQQYPLLLDVFQSRYGSRYLFKRKRHMLYQNPRF